MGVHELAQSERREGRRRRKALVVEGYLSALSPVPPLSRCSGSRLRLYICEHKRAVLHGCKIRPTRLQNPIVLVRVCECRYCTCAAAAATAAAGNSVSTCSCRSSPCAARRQRLVRRGIAVVTVSTAATYGCVYNQPIMRASKCSRNSVVQISELRMIRKQTVQGTRAVAGAGRVQRQCRSRCLV